ncbi:MAG: FAD/FMN-containing dehydrogenase [Gammaproteobacteria bacterium HGW-Gammaproteobacteria-3]|jgi:hypothetical protein|nr:MAG: FAD/FMN-containing dehydrogenase [Gammaproteobacteria bacterium HGW-Gammaproteobacteria-3]
MKKLLPIVLLTVTSLVHAESYIDGSQLTPFSLTDQFDQKHTVDENTRLIMFSKDMDGNDVLKQALTGKKADYLAQRKAVYINDISGMPGVVTFLFAKPKMRDYEYPMLLDEKPQATKNFPARESQATLIQLDHLKIKSIQFTQKPEDVVTALDALKP